MSTLYPPPGESFKTLHREQERGFFIGVMRMQKHKYNIFPKANDEDFKAFVEDMRTNRQLIAIAERMEKRGGSFENALGIAMRFADEKNRRRIADAFPELMEKYDAEVGGADEGGSATGSREKAGFGPEDG